MIKAPSEPIMRLEELQSRQVRLMHTAQIVGQSAGSGTHGYIRVTAAVHTSTSGLGARSKKNRVTEEDAPTDKAQQARRLLKRKVRRIQ